MTRASGERRHPPVWAEAILRALLAPRNRDTISGDLLEEYCEVALPQRGELGATLWYMRQVVSFITIAGLIRATVGWLREDRMFERVARSSWTWLAAGSLGVLILFGSLVESDFRPPVGLGVFIAISIVLTLASLVSMRSRGDAQTLWRIGLAAGLLVTLVLVTRLLVDVFDPVDPLDRFLARVRDDYSEFDYPRRWIPAVAVTVILMGGGLLAAWRTGRVGTGTLAAIVASVSGSVLYLVLVAIGNLLPMGPHGPVPTMLVPVLVMFSTVLGTLGALFGRALGAARTASSNG
ncbi:MAG TPA: hypothetical protein VFS23_35345 [Vicinamibacterales bacterium]|nr:hypothetical protein [Vicinamibacterales bacterium]